MIFEFFAHLFSLLAALFSIVAGALRFDIQAYRLIHQSAVDGMSVAVLLLLVGGLSRMLGQSVVLLINRVTPGRSTVAIFLGALQYALNMMLSIVMIWGLSLLVLPERHSFRDVFTTLSVAYAPTWLGFVVLAPYLGPMLENALHAYVAVGVLMGLMEVFGLSVDDAILSGLIVYLVVRLVNLLGNRLFGKLMEKIIETVTGIHQWISSRDIIDHFLGTD